jgi:hypothetical protein
VNEMGGTYSKHERDEKYIKECRHKYLKRRDLLKELRVGESIILK